MTSAASSARLEPLLGIRHPIVQGPFGGNLSTVTLVAAVSNAGGLGSYGAHALAPEEIASVTANIRKVTSGPFAINLWVGDEEPGGLHPTPEEVDRWWPQFEPYYRELGLPKPDYPAQTGQHFAQQVEALIEARPPVFSFVFGIPSRKVLEALRVRGVRTVGAATTLAEAEALDAAGVDAIVVTGMEAGGHRPSFLASAEMSLTGTFALVQLVAPRVRAAVIAAGGIVDRRGVKAALTLGAHGAQLGTAFLACEESGATPEHRSALWSPVARQTALTRSFSGRLARGIENRWVRETALHREFAPYPLQSWFMSGLRQATVGRTDLVSLWSGQIAPNLSHRTATTLMDSLVSANA